MKYGSVCSGVEAASLAWESLGWKCSFVSEVEPFPCAVLHYRFKASRPINPLDPNAILILDDEWDMLKLCKKQHPASWRKLIDTELLSRYDEYTTRVSWLKQNNKLPVAGEVPNEGDFTKIGDKYRGKIDLLVGGTPCQSFSVAGKRAGLAGVSGLALDFIRLAYESQVKWVVWENVPGCLSTNGGRDFAAFLSGLAGVEITTPKAGWRTAGVIENCRKDRFGLAWRVLDAQFTRVPGFPFAIPQRRRRVFVVGYFGDWKRAAAVLLEPESLHRNTPPCRKAWKDLTGDSERSIADSSGYRIAGFGDRVEDVVASTCKAHGSHEGYGSETLICMAHGQSNAERLDNLGATLSCNHEVPIICVHSTVRRLLPVECERLMGFPDNHTRIPWKGKSEEECPDGPRYKACGNSMCVNVMEWLGRRINDLENIELKV